MCGIVGYVGPRPAVEVVMKGLSRLEYRGYDSAGIAVVTARRSLERVRRAGKLANLTAALAAEPLPDSHLAMGHTRWATHGGPTDLNAHPHVSCDGRIAVVHNGIVENYVSLRNKLADTHRFVTETDTEVIAHLIEERYQGDLPAAVRDACADLEGAFGIVVVHADHPDLLVGARCNSPLVAGVGEGEAFLASDVAAFAEFTSQAVEIEQNCVVVASADGVEITDLAGSAVPGVPYTVDWDVAAAGKGGFATFMDKEIAEQPTAVADTLRGRLGADGHIVLDEMAISDHDLRVVDKVFVVACGSAYHSGLIAKYAIEHWTRLPVEVDIASEFRYRDPVLDARTLVIAISQSGETADTLMALRHARDQHAQVLAICNTVGSTIPRESDAVLYTRAGPEIAVASTKGFITQVTAAYLVGLALAQTRGLKFADEVAGIVRSLQQIPELIEKVLAGMDAVRRVAAEVAEAKAVLFLGRHVGYPVALEGALKLKELAYMHAEAFPAGELKHGPIALVEPGLPVIVITPSPGSSQFLHGKTVSNIQEVRARGARTIVIAEAGDDTVKPFADELIAVPAVPTLLAPLVTTLPLQVFAAELAQQRGNDIDQPRNLAKSVTVE